MEQLFKEGPVFECQEDVFVFPDELSSSVGGREVGGARGGKRIWIGLGQQGLKTMIKHFWKGTGFAF